MRRGRARRGVAALAALQRRAPARGRHDGARRATARRLVSIDFAAFGPGALDVARRRHRPLDERQRARAHRHRRRRLVRLRPRSSATRRSAAFDAPGATPYYCVLHPFMRGEVDVHRVLLDAPTEPRRAGPAVHAARALRAAPGHEPCAIEARHAAPGSRPPPRPPSRPTARSRRDVTPAPRRPTAPSPAPTRARRCRCSCSTASHRDRRSTRGAPRGRDSRA